MQFGYEENHGVMPISPGQNFEIIILCDPQHFKVGMNEWLKFLFLVFLN